MTDITLDLGRFLEGVSFDGLPPDTVPLVRDAFVDTVAVMMVGANEPVAKALRSQITPGGPSRLCLSDLTGSPTDAALLAGTAAHALDYDDQSLTGHPSTVLVPAILAEADAQGADGKQMIAAYVAGYEVWAELIRRNKNYHTKGWHPTSVFGALGAAAACSVLHGLNAPTAANALAIAASHASGLGSNFGTMTKPLHAGIAASAGVRAARLAAAGLGGAADALESHRGFLVAFAPDGSAPDLDSPVEAGKTWNLLWQKLCVKKYPTCYFMHRSFEATVSLLAGRNITHDDIERVEVRMGRGQLAVLASQRPKTGLEAKFSENFAIAAAVVLGRMGVNEVTDEVVARPDIQSMFPKVHLVGEDSSDPRDPAHSMTETVIVTLTSGEVLDSGPIRSVKGHADDPLTEEELWAKFRECTDRTHDEAAAKALFDSLKGLDSLGSASQIPTTAALFRN